MIIIETCPKCGGDLRDKVICTYPPIPRKVCSNCGWSWEGKQEKIVRVPFSSSFPNKKCNKKAPERGQRIKCGPVDDAANELGGVIMTPEEFAKKAEEIYKKNGGQAEANGHIDMDRLMVECLESLGYKDGCDILFSMTHIWYS